MSHGFVLTCWKQFVKTDTRHENFITALNIKQVFREFLNFKNFIYKEKCRYSQNERVCKKRYE